MVTPRVCVFFIRRLDSFPWLTSKNASQKSRRNLPQIIQGVFWATASEAEKLLGRFQQAGSSSPSRRGRAAQAGATFIAIVCLQISPRQTMMLSKASCLLLMTHEYNNAASPLLGVLSMDLNF